MKEAVEIKEIHSKEYSLVHSTNTEPFWCSGCNQEKEGKHMLHSIFFKEYTDVEPICMKCITEDILK